MPRQLVVIRIKNTAFDYTKYGLKNNYFSIDVSISFSYTKNVGVTQYAVLDGTTRLDNVSREPASVALQGVLGEVRGGNNVDMYAYDTAEKNRLQNQMDLLEALRDQAIFLDFITDERAYRNYLITGCNFGKTNFGKIDVNLTIREAITFGDDITVEPANQNEVLSDYEQLLLLDRFNMRAINSDSSLVNETNRIITASEFSTPFIITVGSIAINPDVVCPEYKIQKRLTQTFPLNTGESIEVFDTNYTVDKVDAIELYSGEIAGGNYLQITLPPIQKNLNLYSQIITRNALGGYEYVNKPTTYTGIKLANKDTMIYSTKKGALLKTPFYSDITNGIHYLNYGGSSTDVISEAKYGICFVRKLKDNAYRIVPNLLGSDSRGFLYVASYEKTENDISTIYPVLVYIHPLAWSKIKSELLLRWNESTYFKNKELGGL